MEGECTCQLSCALIIFKKNVEDWIEIVSLNLFLDTRKDGDASFSFLPSP